MATATRRGRFWSARWRDDTGRWREKRTKCRTKTEALVLARDLEHKADRQHLGLEPLPDRRAAMSFADLFSWWWQEYGRRRRSPDIDKVARKHLLPSLGNLALSEVTPARLEGLLVAKTDVLAPRSLNHLRGLVHTVFARAIKRDLWSGANPAALVERRKVPKRPPEYLQPDEAELLLVHLDPHWRPLFAAALFTGMRKGELLGLRKRDVNLRDGTILVGRSYDHDTTKGGHADLIPIAQPLRPFLEAAIRESPSALVFPRPDGSMHPEDVKLDRVLRRALGRAGVVTGYDHRCRRKGCGYSKEEPGNDPGRCPRCNMRLWAKPLPRHVRFHDVRHYADLRAMPRRIPSAGSAEEDVKMHAA
jgi:integrase